MTPNVEDWENYKATFETFTLNSEDLVEGDLVNELFLRSQLPPTQLYAIW
jgi:hypothetical protein